LANRRLRRRHRVEKWQGHDGTGAPEERSTRQVLFEDEHGASPHFAAFVRIWNCGVLTVAG
jgi:hypothetical protein